MEVFGDASEWSAVQGWDDGLGGGGGCRLKRLLEELEGLANGCQFRVSIFYKAHNLVCTIFVTACVFAIPVHPCTFLVILKIIHFLRYSRKVAIEGLYRHEFSFNGE